MLSRQPFHLVSISPWPPLTSLTMLLSAVFLIQFLYGYPLVWPLASLCLLIFILFCWALNIVYEATYQGAHTVRVRHSLTLGWLLFLASEVMFFSSFFWAYFHFGLSPDVRLGSTWPPTALTPISPQSLPLLNTCLLLTSSATVTWSHASLISSYYYKRSYALAATLFLALGFLCCQCIEYYCAPFTIADSCYGSIFYIGTGFHGFHVLLGSLLLLVSHFRLNVLHFTSRRHLGFLFRIWYWHFVDVIWLLLFLVFYVWGS